MIPNNIIQIIETGEFEVNGGMLITGLDFFADDCKIELSLKPGDENVPNQLWEIQIENIREERICYKWFYDIQILPKHKLLEPYLEINKELYIKSKPKSPDELLKDLYVHHRNTFGKLREIEKFFNTEKRLNELCEMEFGLFAKGPETYLEEYKSILEKQETQPYMYGNFKSKKWTGEKWIEENPNLKLLLMGESFFIADEFKFERI